MNKRGIIQYLKQNRPNVQGNDEEIEDYQERIRGKAK